MIEQIVLNYLLNRIGPRVYMEIPEDITEEFVYFRVIDRGISNQINAVTIEIFSYAKDRADAAILDERVRNAMNALDEESSVLSCRLGGGNSDMDSAMKKDRYRCYYNIFY